MSATGYLNIKVMDCISLSVNSVLVLTFTKQIIYHKLLFVLTVTCTTNVHVDSRVKYRYCL